MDFNDDFSEEGTEIGSDELLADDNLRLPDSANPLVRLHAVRAWLKRRQKETSSEIGEAALTLQQSQQEGSQEITRLRRREQQRLMERMQHVQQEFQAAQQRLAAYEEAAALLEECITHTTSSERTLVEYYLSLEELMWQATQTDETTDSPRLQALADVQHRVEHVGAPNEE